MAKDTESNLLPDRRIGRDELNLTEFPFALLSSRPGKDTTYRLEFRDGQKEWIVEGSPHYGLPSAADVEVYVVLMELTRQQGFPIQVSFSRHDVMKRLGWDPNGHNYNRFVQALDRLVAVTIRSKNAFYDAHNRVWERKKAFHILEEYDVTDSRHARPEDGSLFPSWIRWGPELYRNLQAGYIKSLDVDLFLSLRSVIAQALYRYLDAKRGGDGKPLYRIGIKKLAFEHLGLARTYYPSQIKRKLDPAHQELLERRFLDSVEYAPMKNGDEMVIYRFTGRKGTVEPEPTVAPPQAGQPELDSVDEIAQRLMDGGVSRQAAIDLAKLAPEECGRQLQYLPYRAARDSGAVLVKSIREGWAAPPEWTAALQKQQRQERAKRKQAEAEAKISSQEQAESAFIAFWERLPEEQRETITGRAAAELRKENKVISEFGRKHPDSSVYLEALRPYLKAESGFLGADE